MWFECIGGYRHFFLLGGKRYNGLFKSPGRYAFDNESL